MELFKSANQFAISTNFKDTNDFNNSLMVL